MKSYYCENCAFFDELKNEQPCCCCVDGINFVELEGEEQIMSKKQIEEMEKVIADAFMADYNIGCDPCTGTVATALYLEGYRKQSEGEWKVTNNDGFWHYDCPFCDDGYAQETKLPVSNYCANCGAKLSEPKMKGGE